MENKLEFTNSSVVPLYNWEQWDTERNNWNHYKQYPAIPAYDWKYSVWNTENGITKYGYNVKTYDIHRPLYSAHEIEIDSNVNPYDMYQFMPYIYGRDDGGWAIDIEGSFLAAHPGQTIGDLAKDGYVFKRPKTNTLYFQQQIDKSTFTNNSIDQQAKQTLLGVHDYDYYESGKHIRLSDDDLWNMFIGLNPSDWYFYTYEDDPTDLEYHYGVLTIPGRGYVSTHDYLYPIISKDFKNLGLGINLHSMYDVSYLNKQKFAWTYSFGYNNDTDHTDLSYLHWNDIRTVRKPVTGFHVYCKEPSLRGGRVNNSLTKRFTNGQPFFVKDNGVFDEDTQTYTVKPGFYRVNINGFIPRIIEGMPQQWEEIIGPDYYDIDFTIKWNTKLELIDPSHPELGGIESNNINNIPATSNGVGVTFNKTSGQSLHRFELYCDYCIPRVNAMSGSVQDLIWFYNDSSERIYLDTLNNHVRRTGEHGELYNTFINLPENKKVVPLNCLNKLYLDHYYYSFGIGFDADEIDDNGRAIVACCTKGTYSAPCTNPTYTDYFYYTPPLTESDPNHYYGYTLMDNTFYNRHKDLPLFANIIEFTKDANSHISLAPIRNFQTKDSEGNNLTINYNFYDRCAWNNQIVGDSSPLRKHDQNFNYCPFVADGNYGPDSSVYKTKHRNGNYRIPVNGLVSEDEPLANLSHSYLSQPIIKYTPAYYAIGSHYVDGEEVVYKTNNWAKYYLQADYNHDYDPPNTEHDYFALTNKSYVGRMVPNALRFPEYYNDYVEEVTFLTQKQTHRIRAEEDGTTTRIVLQMDGFKQWDIETDGYYYKQPSNIDGHLPKQSCYPAVGYVHTNEDEIDEIFRRRTLNNTAHPILLGPDYPDKEDTYLFYQMTYGPKLYYYLPHFGQYVGPPYDDSMSVIVTSKQSDWLKDYEVMMQWKFEAPFMRNENNNTVYAEAQEYNNDAQLRTVTPYSFSVSMPHFDDYASSDEEYDYYTNPTVGHLNSVEYKNYLYQFNGYDANNQKQFTTNCCMYSYGLFNTLYMNMHSYITPKPFTRTQLTSTDIYIGSDELHINIMDNYFSYQLTRQPERDYQIPGQKGLRYYGDMDYSKWSSIYPGDVFHKDYSYVFSGDNTQPWLVEDYGENAVMQVPNDWQSATWFDTPNPPTSGQYILNVTTPEGTTSTTVYIQFDNQSTHAAQPYQPTNNVRKGTAVYVEEPRSATLPKNYQRIKSGDTTTWEVWDFARYENHPTTFIKYVESQLPSTYPSPHKPGGYDAQTDSWVSGNLNGYWYWRIADTTTHQLTLYDKDIKDGCKYSQSVNPNSDLTFGTAAAAELKFDYYNTANNANTLLNQPFIYWKRNPGETWTKVGLFTNADMSLSKRYASFTAYDDMIYTDINADAFLQSTTWPIAVNQFFYNLCDYCDISYNANCIQNTDSSATATYFVNATHQIQNNFTSVNVSARTVFSYIAQLLNCFFAIDKDGKIYAGKFTNKIVDGNIFNLDNHKYTESTTANYTIPAVTKVIIKAGSTAGFSKGTDGTNYYVVDNPLLFADAQSEVQDILDDMLNVLSVASYTPGNVKLLKDYGIKVGDIIKVDNKTFYVMNKTMDGSTTTFQCLGSQARTSNYDTQNSEIIALRGETAEIGQIAHTVDTDLTNINNRFAVITGEISTLNGMVKGHDKTIEAQELDIDELQRDMSIAEVSINTLVTGFNNIYPRVTRLEAQVPLKMDKADMKSLHMATYKNNTGVFFGPQGIYYCEIDSSKQPIHIVYYINFVNGTTNLTAGPAIWQSSIPSEIIW